MPVQAAPELAFPPLALASALRDAYGRAFPMRLPQHPAVHRTLLLLALGLASCGADEPAPVHFPIGQPKLYERDFDLTLKVARQLQQGPLQALLSAPHKQAAPLLAAVLHPSFAGRFPDPDQGTPVADPQLEIWDLSGAQLEPRDGPAFVRAWMAHSRPWRRVERASVEVSRLWLVPQDSGHSEPDQERVVGRAEVQLAGLRQGGGRSSLKLSLVFEALRQSPGPWLLTRLDCLSGEKLRGPAASFRSITRETGIDYRLSPRNRSLGQSFVDEHQTLALGGLSALDWNGDGFWDLLGSRRGQLSTLFLNDGQGGFTPAPLPVEDPRQSGAFLLYVDLDGDGREELVNSRVLSYEGGRAQCGLYTREGERWILHPKAFSFPNPVGLRRLAIQTVVPLDADGDGLLDLFFAVYGSATSRGRAYNSVEAHDGADNHLFINQGNLVFREESNQRGISGTQYTYVASAFDFDADGDQDLFEGNDFGPNILWLNDGQGHFTKDTQSGLGGVSAYSMGVTLADYDNTGRWSLYVSNMSSAAGARMVDLPTGLDPELRERVRVIASGNRLFEQGPEGRWTEGAEAAGVARAGWAWGAVFADLDNDGDQDLFVTNGFTSHSQSDLPDWQPWFWRQVLDDADALQLGRAARDANIAVGAFRGSFNGNERDHYYHNPDGASGRFVDAAYVRGLDLASDGRCVLPVDVDGDGDLDLALWTLQGLELFENRAPARAFTRISLISEGGAACTLGALVSVTCAGQTQRQIQRLVDGFQSQVPGHLHFGLGTQQSIDQLSVRWPSGLEQSWSDLPAGRLLLLREGVSEAEARELPAWPAATRPRGVAPSASTIARRLGHGVEALAPAGQALLLHLAADAAAPWAEASALRAAYPELRLVRLLPAPAFQGATASELYATYELDADLKQQLFGAGPSVRPSSFLFDTQGQLTRAFLRQVYASELQACLEELAHEPPFPGLLLQAGRRALAQGRFREARELFLRAVSDGAGEPAAYDGLARAQRLLARPDLAEEAYRLCLTLDPDYALGHFNLGTSLVARQALPEAVLEYQQVLRIQPDDLRAHLALAEALLLMQDLEGATQAFREALLHVPSKDVQERTSVLLTLGRLLGQRKRLEEATLVLKEVLSLDPHNAPARRALDLVDRLQRQARER